MIYFYDPFSLEDVGTQSAWLQEVRRKLLGLPSLQKCVVKFLVKFDLEFDLKFERSDGKIW